MGLDQTSFVSPELVPTSLICPICAGVVENPVITASEHLFCEPCLIEWLTKSSICPMTNCEISIESVTTPGRLILSILSELLRKCPHAGCTWQGHSDQFLFHTKVCPLRPKEFILVELEQALACNRELLIKIKALERKCLDAEYSNRELEHRSILIERKLKVFNTFFGQQDIPVGLTARSAPTNPHSPAYAPIALTRRSSASKLDELGDWKSDIRYSGQLTPGIVGISSDADPGFLRSVTPRLGSRSPCWSDSSDTNYPNRNDYDKIYVEREREKFPMTIDVETDITGGGPILSTKSDRSDSNSYLHRLLREKYGQDRGSGRYEGLGLGENSSDRMCHDSRGVDTWKDKDICLTETDILNDGRRKSYKRDESGKYETVNEVQNHAQKQGPGQGQGLSNLDDSVGGLRSRSRGRGSGTSKYLEEKIVQHLTSIGVGYHMESTDWIGSTSPKTCLEKEEEEEEEVETVREVELLGSGGGSGNVLQKKIKEENVRREVENKNNNTD